MTEMSATIVQRTWITVVGWSPMAVINTLWQACEQGIVPHRVVLLASPDDRHVQRSVGTVLRYLYAILPRFGVPSPQIEQTPIDENDFMGFWRTLAKTLADERTRAERLVIDTTPGRKYMSAFAIVLGRKPEFNLEKVYYNHMLGQQYNNVPHPLIPRHEQQLYDLLDVMSMRPPMPGAP